MDKKFELVGNGVFVGSKIVFRIKALKDFGDVKKGDLGGFVEKEVNLSHEGECWIYNDACVYGCARLYQNAKIYDNVRVYDFSEVCGDANIHGASKIHGSSTVYGSARFSDNVEICGYASVCDSANISGNVTIMDNAHIMGASEISGNVVISGNTIINSNMCINDNVDIDSNDKISYIENIGDEYSGFTFFLNKGTIMVSCEEFTKTIDEFRETVNEKYKDSKYLDEYLTLINLMEIHFKNTKNI